MEKTNKYRFTDRLLVIGSALAAGTLIFYGAAVAPLIDVVVTGEETYYEYDKNETHVLFVAAALVLLTALIKKYNWMRVFSLVAIVTPFYTYITSQFEEKSIIDQATGALKESAYDFAWGAAVLLLGLTGLMSCIFFSFRKKKTVYR